MKNKFNGQANKGGVYKITNLKNGKIYIGSAKHFKVRASQHRSSLVNQKHQNKHLQASWNKWGEDAFLFEVVETVNGSTEERRKKEQKYIDNLIKEGKWNNTFNFQKKVNQIQGKWSSTPEITSKKRSLLSKQRWKNPDFREKMCKIQKNICNKNERKQMMSLHFKELWKTTKIRAKMLKNLELAREKAQTQNVREKISNTLKRRYVKENHPNFGKNHPLDTKRKIMLSSKNKQPVIVQHCQNGSTLEFPSLGSASRHFGFHISSVRRAAKTGKLLDRCWIVTFREVMHDEKRRKQKKTRNSD